MIHNCHRCVVSVTLIPKKLLEVNMSLRNPPYDRNLVCQLSILLRCVSNACTIPITIFANIFKQTKFCTDTVLNCRQFSNVCRTQRKNSRFQLSLMQVLNKSARREKNSLIIFQVRPPLVICVKINLMPGGFEENLASLGLTEGRDYVHFA